tara:strand:+ start:180 stop:584 length:405 start_codon:yes stop_codon:yes gene_type:complete
MEDFDIPKAKKNLFAKAFAALNDNPQMMVDDEPDMNMMIPKRPPLNFNLDYDPRTERKVLGIDYTQQLGNNRSFNIGGTYQPQFETEQQGYMGENLLLQNPSNYNLRTGYQGKNFGVNLNIGTGGGNMGFNRQF